MERCIRCKRSEEEVSLLDGIYLTGSAKVCERCSLIDNIPVLKAPTVEQLKDSERTESIRARVMRLSGMKPEQKQRKTLAEELEKIQEKTISEKPSQMPVQLVDNFHWIVLYMRRRRKITAKQLAEAIGESEMTIKLVEQNKLPGNYLPLIKKIEQYFGVRLIKQDLREIILKENELEKNRKSLELKERQLKEQEDAEVARKKETLKKEMIEQARTKGIDKDFVSNIPLADLMRRNEQIEKDFSYKTREEVGREQLVDFGKEEIPKIDKFRHVNTIEKKDLAKSGKAPTIYELVKKKEEKDRALTGKDIEVVDESKEL